jgi:hypothetical protein
LIWKRFHFMFVGSGRKSDVDAQRSQARIAHRHSKGLELESWPTIDGAFDHDEKGNGTHMTICSTIIT